MLDVPNGDQPVTSKVTLSLVTARGRALDSNSNVEQRHQQRDEQC